MTRKSSFIEQGKNREPIAIIGIGCRFPGGADNPEKFWQLLINEVDTITEIPSDRDSVKPYYDPTPASPGKIISNVGGFLDHVDLFDASFFDISPREANYIDPQQRLLLEIAWEALDDAGQIPENLKTSQTGVFIGMWTNDYADKMNRVEDDIDLYVTTGGGRYAASGRLSYFFGFQGPSLTLDTACSSSLVSVHLACQSLRDGESSLALAGGVNLILEPSVSIGYSRSKMLSPDGRCKFGDASANGYVRSEGAGIVVLKRLSEAVADQDRVYAIIRGSAVNNDGRSSDLLVAPGISSQVNLMHEAYLNANISPSQVGYVEAHGTGTPVGDPVELQAIGQVLSEGRPPDQPCMIGSVKTNFGHTESASGIAGLIKVMLCLKHKAIPASLHFKEPNSKIPWEKLPLVVQTKLTTWPEVMEPAIAVVNSFGITGTNAHIVLSEAPKPIPARLDIGSVPNFILPLSAKTPEALKGFAKSYLDFLTHQDTPDLHDICYTASCRRTHLSERAAFVGSSVQALQDQLSLFSNDPLLAETSRLDEQAKVVFVFPGQGGQWFKMGRELLENNPVFRETIQACERAIQPWVDWSLMEQLTLDENSGKYRLNEISVIQPVLFALEVALAAVWRSWGIEPQAVIGHSLGETAAAFVAGALSLEDAAQVICKRSQLMQRTSGQGAMAVVGLSFDEAFEALQGHESKLSVAVHNSPRSTVLSGDPQALDEIMETLAMRDIFCRRVKVDVASHSPQMDPLRPELVASLAGIQPRSGMVPFYSTVTGSVSEGLDLSAEYWGRNLRQPVQFGNTVQKLIETGHTVFIEMGPHPILLSSIQEVSAALGQPAYGIASLRRDQPEAATILGELGALYKLGYPVDWNRLYPSGGRVVSLPAYPWQRERFWLETTTSPGRSRPGAHPYLSNDIHAATGVHTWETMISTKLFPYLNDHRVRGSVVFPASAYVEMTLAAAAEVFGTKPANLKDIRFLEALLLSDQEERVIQLVLSADTQDSSAFQIFSRSAPEASSGSWTLHATGAIELAPENRSKERISLEALSSGQTETTAESFYRLVAERSLDYGTNFQAITRLVEEQNGILAHIKLSEDLVSQAAKYRLHPVLIDACFQVLLAALPESNRDTYLPTLLETLESYAAPNFSHSLQCLVTSKPDETGVTGDISLVNGDGQLVMTARGLHLQKLEAEDDLQGFLYEVAWQESPIPNPEKLTSNHWLIFADRQGAAKTLADILQGAANTCTLVFPGKAYRTVGPNQYELDPLQPTHFEQLFKDITSPVQCIVHLWSLDLGEEAATVKPNLASILHLTQRMATLDLADPPQLWLVTRGTQAVQAGPEPVSASQSAVWGMGAVIANELPGLRCRRVDLSPNGMEGEIDLLARVLQSDDNEDQVALRNRQRYAARLGRYQPLAGSETKQVLRQKIEKDQPFQVRVITPGILDGLSLKPDLRKSPGAGEVELTVRATGLNFMNVMAGLGILPGYVNGIGPLGIECAGVISRVGEGVRDFQVGDEVAAIAFDCLGSHTVTDARLVVKKPDFLGFEEAASIPIAYLTSYYALYSLGRLQPGERVLIHSATGGVGLAAVHLAQRLGAEVFATAGTVEKREYLSRLGIGHIMDSRSLTFAEEVMKETQGEGVDLILNSLAGNAIAKGLEILKPYGRFLEIGKRDIYQNSKMGLFPFQKNLSYFAVDLDKMSRERPDVVGNLLRDVFNLLEKREIPALPVQTFPVSQSSDAFRLMAQAGHIGKIVISMEDPQAAFEIPAGMTPVRTEGTYLITGGFGDLGLLFADWLASQGARHLTLLGRSDPSERARKAIGDLEEAGVQIVAARADVSDREKLEEVLSRIKENQPPLKGVIHAAGFLEDGTIPQMDFERFMRVFATKALGAWHLHTLTAGESLDFFIMFSSVAATLGTPGQINYAAGNAFMDGLAKSRHAQNLPALSINWGPWSQIGLASTEANRGERLAQQGLKSISPTQGLDVMPFAMAGGIPQISVVSLDAKKWCSAQPAAARSSLFKSFLQEDGVETGTNKPSGKNIRDELLAVHSGKQRRTLFETHVKEQVAQVLHLSPTRVPLEKPLKTLGLDSLLSIELRNRLEETLHVKLSATLIWNYPTVSLLTQFLAEKIEISFEQDNKPAEGTPQGAQRQAPLVDDGQTSAADEENLTKAELDALLQEEMNALEDLLGEN